MGGGGGGGVRTAVQAQLHELISPYSLDQHHRKLNSYRHMLAFTILICTKVQFIYLTSHSNNELKLSNL